MTAGVWSDPLQQHRLAVPLLGSLALASVCGFPCIVGAALDAVGGKRIAGRAPKDQLGPLASTLIVFVVGTVANLEIGDERRLPGRFILWSEDLADDVGLLEATTEMIVRRVAGTE